METKENYNEHKKGEPHMDKRGNISSRNMRLFAAIMTLIEALVLTSLTGCSGKKVDYGNESEIKETKNMSVLADIRADSGWNENFTIQTGNGEKTVYVNANIVVPDCDNMSVVEVENIKIDVDYKKRFLDLYFGGNEYYYHDPDHYTVDELNEIIEDWQKTQDETYSEELEQRLAEYRDKLETAKTTYTVAKDLENCEVFAGYKGDVFCEVDFEAHKVHAYALHQSGTDYGPPSLRNKDYDIITQSFQDEDLKDKADETSNEGNKSAASAKKEAGNFLSKLGMQDLVERGECECSWVGFNTDSKEENDYQTAAWGYIYSYATGIDGIAFKDGFDMDTYWSVYEANDSYIDDVALPDSTLLTVTDEDYVGNIRNVVLRMKLYVGQYSKLWRDYFDYFLQVIDSYQWKKELEINKKKDMILLYDCWANIPGKYRNTLLYVKNKIDDYINQIMIGEK